MKNLILNRNFALALCTVFAMMFVFSSCGKDDVVNNTTEFTDDHANAAFKKEVTTKGIEESKEQDFTFKVSSNSEEIVNAFDKSSFSFRFISEEEVQAHSEDEALLAERDLTDDEYNIDSRDESTPNGDTFVTISLIRIANTDELYEALPAYELELSQEVLDIIKKTKATTVFDFNSKIEQYTNIDENNIDDRGCNPCYAWSNNRKVIIKGDCGNDWTRTTNYYAKYGQYNQSWERLPDTYFKCRSYLGACCKGDRWVRKIVVTHDVVAKVVGYTNTCYDSWCGPLNLNSCNGYYPNGC